MELLKSIAPMILAVFFSYTAAVFASMGFKKDENKKIAFIGAFFIELVSFTIWLPCFSDLFDIFGLANEAKQRAMLITTCLILSATVLAMLFNMRKKEI